MLDWSGARNEAASTAEAWTREGGPGGAIVLFDRDGIREVASGGFAAIEHRLPFTPDTPNRLASISKHICAAMLLRAGVPLDEPLGNLLSKAPPALAAVPLARALDMTGGLPDTMEAFWQQGVPFTASLGADEILARAQLFPALNAEPGTEMAYSNTGWRLGQRILEQVTGKPYKETVAELSGELGAAFRLPYDGSALQRAAALSEGSVKRALSYVDPETLALVEAVRARLDALPGVDLPALLALGEEVAGKAGEAEFAVMIETVQGWLSGHLHAHAAAGPARLAPLAEVWERLARAAREVETYNLDRRPLVMSLFHDLSEAVARSRAA